MSHFQPHHGREEVCSWRQVRVLHQVRSKTIDWQGRSCDHIDHIAGCLLAVHSRQVALGLEFGFVSAAGCEECYASVHLDIGHSRLFDVGIFGFCGDTLSRRFGQAMAMFPFVGSECFSALTGDWESPA